MITLVAATTAIARAVLDHGPVPVPHCPDWPHPATADALRALADHPEHAGEGTFLICHSGTVVGECGWYAPPGPDGEVEISFGLAPSARGRGLAAEAVGQLVAWTRTRGALVVRAEVRPGNLDSLRLLDRLGFVPRGERAGHLVLELA